MADADARLIFWSWWNVSAANADLAKPIEHYLLRWETSWRNARRSTGGLDAAMAHVAAQNIADPIAKLVALCRQLARISADGVFHLDCRTAGDFVGVSFKTASRWLNHSCGLTKVLVGKFRGKSNDWRFSDLPVPIPTISTAL